jgi:hypothetical protein
LYPLRCCDCNSLSAVGSTGNGSADGTENFLELV